MIYSLFRLPYVGLLLVGFLFLTLLGLNPNICRLLRHLGPSFVKLGQTLSVRPDIVGKNYARQLQLLQDSMPPFAAHKAVRTIEKELDSTISQLFLTFDLKPIAAASIAQVHKAILQDGSVVAVKILRPHIERAFKRDIRLFYILARIISVFPASRRLRFIEVVQTFEHIVRKELDLRFEAASASELAENLALDQGVRVPKIFWQQTTRKIMTSEWIDGVPLHNIEKLTAQGQNLPALARNMYLIFLNQAYRDGFFHGDIHPGNVLVTSNGIIVPVDFGIMGRIDDKTKYYVTEILRGFLTADYEHVARIHFEAGYVPEHHSIGDFTLALRAIGEPIFNIPSKHISVAKLLTHLFKVTRDFDMQTQPQLLLLQKTLVLIEGVCLQLDPEINLWECAKPWVTEWAKSEYGIKQRVKKQAKSWQHILSQLPETLTDFANTAHKTLHSGVIVPKEIMVIIHKQGRLLYRLQWIIFVMGIGLAILALRLY